MITPERVRTRGEVRHCGWCGQRLPDSANKSVDKSGGTGGGETGGKPTRVGRPRRYCSQSCRQRAYERRSAVQRGGLPEDAVVLSAAELADLQDRLFQLRCAAEDVVTAADDGADPGELKSLAAAVVENAHGLERLR
ncbi:hypothetical protein [Actinophytocola sp.]|uniref:hypothetical protein n=1 Tax=Actinophytocola sp. TaxID=1872138 RepID=UPI00389A3900